MVTEKEKTVLIEMLGNLTRPALRALCIRYGTSRVKLWSKRKDELIEALLEHADELLSGSVSEENFKDNFTNLEQGQSEIKATQVELIKNVKAEQQNLISFLETKMRVSPWEKISNSIGGWASIIGFVLAVITTIVQILPKPQEFYELKINVLEEDGSHALGANVYANPWELSAKKDHWVLLIPVNEVPEDEMVRVVAQKNNTEVEKNIRLANRKQFSVTLWLRHPTAIVSGVVLSPMGEPIGGVSISVFGYEKDAVLSEVDGTFSLPVHAPSGEEVRISAQKGYWRRTGHYIAGEHCEINLKDKSH